MHNTASEKLHHDSHTLLEDKSLLSWGLPISALKQGQEQTHLVLPREMNFKMFRWTEFILNLSTQSQKTTCSLMAGTLPPRLGHASLLPRALTRIKDATFLPKDPQSAQLDRARRNGTPLSTRGAGLLPTQTWGPAKGWMRCCPLALREAGPGTAARQLSGTHCPHFPSCGHLSLLPYIKSYQLFCQQSHMAPPSAKWLQIPLAKGDADQASDPLWKDPILPSTFSDASAWCIKKYLYLKFSNTAWINCKRLNYSWTM